MSALSLHSNQWARGKRTDFQVLYVLLQPFLLMKFYSSEKVTAHSGWDSFDHIKIFTERLYIWVTCLDPCLSSRRTDTSKVWFIPSWSRYLKQVRQIRCPSLCWPLKKPGETISDAASSHCGRPNFWDQTPLITMLRKEQEPNFLYVNIQGNWSQENTRQQNPNGKFSPAKQGLHRSI